MRIKTLLFLGGGLLALSVLSLLERSSNVWAATDGLLANTSSGTSDVQLIVQEQVQVENLIDIDLDNGDGFNIYVPGGGDVSGTTTPQVWT